MAHLSKTNLYMASFRRFVMKIKLFFVELQHFVALVYTWAFRHVSCTSDEIQKFVWLEKTSMRLEKRLFVLDTLQPRSLSNL